MLQATSSIHSPHPKYRRLLTMIYSGKIILPSSSLLIIQDYAPEGNLNLNHLNHVTIDNADLQHVVGHSVTTLQ